MTHSTSKFVYPLIVFCACAIPLTANASVFSGLLQLSSDVFTNPTSQHKTEVEPDTFAFGSTIVTAFQVGRFVDGGASDIGWATSTDAGRTWSHGYFPGDTKFEGNGPYDRVSDASVAYDSKHHVWMVSSLAIYDQGQLTSPAVIVNRSTNGGVSWQDPVSVYSEGKSGNLDKNWTVCDNWKSSPFYGHCYTEWDSPDSWNTIAMSTSTDGGISWSAPQGTADQASGLGGQPLVQPNGTVVVPIGDGGLSSLQSFVSKDGGKTWSATAPITDLQTHAVANNVRTEPLPSAEVDGSGKVYLVWQDCRFERNCSTNDLVMSTSMDGVNWSPVIRIPTDPVGSDVDHFIPGIAVDPATSGATAHLSVTYYYYPKADCHGTGCQLRVASVSSQDGGTSWTPPVELGSHAVDWRTVPQTSQGVMVGDYISSSFVGGSSRAVFAMSPSAGGELGMFTSAAPSQARLRRVFVRPEPVLSDHSDHPMQALLRLF